MSNSDSSRVQPSGISSGGAWGAGEPATQEMRPDLVAPRVVQPTVAEAFAAPSMATPAYPVTSPAFGSGIKSPTVAVNNYVAAPAVQLSHLPHRQPFLLRAVWFLLVGWWLSGLAILLSYALFVFVLTIPVGIWLLHRVPQMQTLRGRSREFQTDVVNGQVVIRERTIAQLPFWQRAVWFIFVGWWLTAIWLSVAWGLSVLILTLPLSVMMIDRAPGILTLQKH